VLKRGDLSLLHLAAAKGRMQLADSGDLAHSEIKSTLARRRNFRGPLSATENRAVSEIVTVTSSRCTIFRILLFRVLLYTCIVVKIHDAYHVD
jgi:hypothetical protein